MKHLIAVVVLIAAIVPPGTAGETEAAIKKLLDARRDTPGSRQHRDAIAKVMKQPSPADQLDALRINAELRTTLSIDELVALATPHRRGIAALVVSADGSRLASTSWDGKLTLTEFGGAQLGKRWQFDASPSGVALSTDGKRVLLGSDDEFVYVREHLGDELKPLYKLGGHKLRPFALAVSPTGNIFASGNASPTLRVWKASDAEPEAWAVLTKPVDGAVGINSLAVSCDGKLLAAGHLVGKATLRVWKIGDTLEEVPLNPLLGHVVAFSPVDPLLAFSGSDGKIALWDFAGKPKEALVIEGHRARDQQPVRSLAFSPDGSRLASAGSDKRLTLWNVGTGKCEKFWDLPDELRALAWHPDGRHLMVGNGDGSLYVFRLAKK